jgi:hypothetical protein
MGVEAIPAIAFLSKDGEKTGDLTIGAVPAQTVRQLLRDHAPSPPTGN